MKIQVAKIVDDWVAGTIKEIGEKNGYASTHYNELSEFFQNIKGNLLLELSCEVFKLAEAAIEKYDPTGKYTPFIYIPLGYFDNITFWEGEFLEKLGRIKEPPSLYILLPEDIFIETYEEYRRPIPLPSQFGEMIGIYRCFRTKEEIDNNEEFTGAICLFSQTFRP